MYAKEHEKALFALELQFEQAASCPRLSARDRQQEMQAVVERMFANVMAAYRTDARVGAHLAELALDYLAREDVAVDVVKNAFNRHGSTKVVAIYEQMLLNEMRRTVARIENHRPVPAVAVAPSVAF